MKKLRTAVAALVIAAGAFGAYAFTNANTEITKETQDVLHWFQPQGTNPGFINSNTIDAQEAASDGCVQLQEGCQRGYTSAQLNNPNNPSAGVRTNQVGSPAATLGLEQ